jgi:hypothetical protein
MPLELFEAITQPLTEYEKETLLPAIVKGFEKRIGAGNAITEKTICRKMREAGYKLTGVTLRKIVHHIRQNHLINVLMGTSKGYYVTRDANEIKQQVRSLIGRENSIRSVRIAMEETLNKLET